MNRQQRRAAEKRQKKAIRQGASVSNDAAGQAAFVQSRLAEALRQHKSGNLQSAEEAYREVIELRPDIAAAHNALGALYNSQGRHEDALKAFDSAFKIDPNLPEISKNRANTLSLLGQASGTPDSNNGESSRVDELFNNANRLRATGDLQGAIEIYQEIIKLKPDHAPTYSNLGIILDQMGNFKMAEQLIQSSLLFDPKNASTQNALGLTYLNQGRITDAISALTKALQINATNVSCLTNLGNAYKDAGQVGLALETYRKALDVAPRAEIHSNILFAMNYLPEFDQRTILSEHRIWNETYAKPVEPRGKVHKNLADPDKRLKLGLLSGSFRRHPVGFLTIAAIEALSKDRFELFCYTNSTQADPLTKRFRATADHWTSVVGVSDESLSEQIEDDGIDILIDLAGHSDGLRVLTMARQPAPVQVKWVGGQFNTTGMDCFDYFLSDRVETPEGVDDFYTEEIVRLPDGYVCYDAPDYMPNVEELPAVKNGYITFGCFNNVSKVTPQTIEFWSDILRQVDGSRLILKSKALNDKGVRDQFLAKFVACGIHDSSVELRGSSPHPELLSQYNDIDIALDPFPYSGGLTTVEALYMGVPVVTKPGETFAARHAASHLTNAGLRDWVCDTFEDYSDIAISWAHNLDALSQLRQELRQKVKASPLCDGEKFAKNLETALKKMWRHWCDAQAPHQSQAAHTLSPTPPKQDSSIMESQAIFVGGHSRTGTTLMHGQICKSDETIAVTKESSYLRALVEAFELGSRWFRAHTDDYFDSLDDFRSFHSHILETYFEHVAERFGANKRLVQKEPRMTPYFPELAQLMPNAKFVFMLRDPRDIVASQMTRAQKSDYSIDVQAEVDRLTNTHKRIAQNEDLLKDRLLYVRYEDLTLDPVKTLRRVYDFLGLTWSEDLRDTTWKTKRPRFDDSASELDEKAITSTSIGRYQDVFNDDLIRAFNDERGAFEKEIGFDTYFDLDDEAPQLGTQNQTAGSDSTTSLPHSELHAQHALSKPRQELLSMMPRNAVCAEIGVWKGEFSQQIKNLTRPKELTLIDPWAFQPSFPNRMFGGSVATSQDDMDAIYQSVVSQFAYETVKILRMNSTDAAAQFPDSYFDWVYVDGNHYYEYVLSDLQTWLPKVRPGGFLTGDDYLWHDDNGRQSVKAAVTEFLNATPGLSVTVIGDQFIINMPGA